jgi:hypothetical protein
LNFSVGNIIGLTELDVDNVELLQGASSALYGSGGMNGTLLMNSKSPFKYQGLSFQAKQGFMHFNDPALSNATPYYDWSLRYAKKISEKFAFRISGQFIKADDWQATDYRNLKRENVFSSLKDGNRDSDPNYDGVNVFGDEASASLSALAQAGIFGPDNPTLPGVVQALTLANGGTPPTQAQIIGHYANTAAYGANPQTAPLYLMANGLARGYYGSQYVHNM